MVARALALSSMAVSIWLGSVSNARPSRLHPPAPHDTANAGPLRPLPQPITDPDQIAHVDIRNTNIWAELSTRTNMWPELHG